MGQFKEMKIIEIISESKEIKTKKNPDGFTIDLIVDGKHVGQYTHAREDDIVRNQAEIFPEYRNKGYGTMLLLAAIKTADDLGLDFEEDTQSLTPAMSRIYDELDDSGMIYGGSGAWVISPGGEVELEDFLNEDLRKFVRKESINEDMPEMAPVYPNIKSGINDAYSTIDGIDYAIVRLQKTIAEEYGDDIPDEYQEPLNFILDIMNKKLPSALRHIADIAKGDEVYESINEDLRAWFGKGKKGGAGGGGWDRYNTKGERIGKCGDAKDGEGKPKCLSKSRAASLRSSGGKKAIANAVKRKKAKDPNPNRKGKAKNVNSHPKK